MQYTITAVKKQNLNIKFMHKSIPNIKIQWMWAREIDRNESCLRHDVYTGGVD